MIQPLLSGEIPVPDEVHIKVISPGGSEMLKAKVPEDTDFQDVKSYIGEKISCNPNYFDLVTDRGVKLDGAAPLSQHRPDDGSVLLLTVELNLISTLPKISSQRFVQMQRGLPDGAKPTFRGEAKASGVFSCLLSVQAVTTMVGAYFLLRFVFGFILGLFNIKSLWWAYLYPAYLIEALFSHTSLLMMQVSEEQDVTSYIEQIKEALITPCIQAEVYHMERRTSGSGKNRSTRNVKVTDFTLEDTLKVDHWIDETPETMPGLFSIPLLHIHFRFAWKAGDEQTAQQWQLQRDNLTNRARTSCRGNQKWNFSESIESASSNVKELLRGKDGKFLPEKVFCIRDQMPCCFSWCWYFWASVFGLSWAYRAWVYRISFKGDYEFSRKGFSHA